MRRFIRTSIFARRTHFWRGVLFVAALPLMWWSLQDGPTPYDAIIVPLVLTLFLTPVVIWAIVQFGFSVYYTVTRGNPFLQDAPDNVIIIDSRRDEAVKKEKKFCPVCKRKTSCRIKRSFGLGAWIHVQRG